MNKLDALVAGCADKVHDAHAILAYQTATVEQAIRAALIEYGNQRIEDAAKACEEHIAIANQVGDHGAMRTASTLADSCRALKE